MKLTKFFAFALAALAFVGCGNDSNTDQPFNSSLFLTVNDSEKVSVQIDDVVTFKVTDDMGNDVTAQASIYSFDKKGDMVRHNEPTFTATQTGRYEFFATLGAQNSNYATISVLAQMPDYVADPQPSNLKFNHRVLLIDHTGVNCGYCPFATDALREVAATDWHNHYSEVTCHAGDFAGGDPANSKAANALNKYQESIISGYPSILVNFFSRAGSYTKPYIISALEEAVNMNGAEVGISMAVTGDPEALYCAAEVKAAVAGEYRVTAWLLESKISSPKQANAKKDYHKIYDNALRNMAHKFSETNVQGGKDEQYTIAEGATQKIAFTLPVTSTKWNYENMSVVVIVTKNTSKGWDVVNTLSCPINESKAFEYLQ
ncbi:MAG: Omp28-related outer membrane protein [Alistipes sp.]|nr:Omp28-related outer membrane protein [Alistipes sp.]